MEQKELKQQLLKEALKNIPEYWGAINEHYLSQIDPEEYFGL